MQINFKMQELRLEAIKKLSQKVGIPITDQNTTMKISIFNEKILQKYFGV